MTTLTIIEPADILQVPAAVQAAVSGIPAGPYLAILGAMLCLAIAQAPLAVAAGLRISIDA